MNMTQFQWLLKVMTFTALYLLIPATTNAQKKDTTIIDKLYTKGKSFRYTNRDSALFYLKQVEKLSKDLNYKRGSGYALYEYGLHEWILSNKFKYFTQALELFESAHDKFGVGIALVKVGGIYVQIGQDEKALMYFKKALVVKKEINDFGGAALALIEIGLYYKKIGELDEALRYFKESLVYRLKEDTHQGIAYAQVNIADVLFLQNKFDKALTMGDSALHNFSLTTDLSGQVWALYLKGKLMIEFNKTEEAEKIFQVIDKFPEEMKYNYNRLHAKEALIKMYSNRGDIKNAFELQSEYLSVKDTLAKWDYRAETRLLVNEYEFEMAEQEALKKREFREQQLARRNNIEYMIIAVFVFILFAILFSGRKLFNVRLINAFLFIGLLLLFEFLLVVTDPKIESLTQGEPFLKLLTNIVLALLVLPAHQFLEKFTRKRLIGERLLSQ
jgi:tetratricopeptide (TPR) repeat protein